MKALFWMRVRSLAAMLFVLGTAGVRTGMLTQRALTEKRAATLASPLSEQATPKKVAKNGRPLANIEVVFLAEVGHYRLRTDNGDDGAAVGKYRVRIFDPLAKPKTPPEKRRVPPRYDNFTDTPPRRQGR